MVFDYFIFVILDKMKFQKLFQYFYLSKDEYFHRLTPIEEKLSSKLLIKAIDSIS